MMKKVLFTILGICCFAFNAYADNKITVYTVIELDRLPKYKKILEEKLPEYEIIWVRESTGIITAKLLAEAKNPQADLVFGVTGSSLLILEEHGIFEPYTPKGIEKISSNMRDADDVPSWIGMYAWTSGFCVNTVELEKHGLAMPTSWQDLTKPEYKDLIAMPDPASSGTGYMNLNAWIQMFGEENAWEYAEGLLENTKFLTHSGSAPCSMAAQGEVAIGISSAFFVEHLLKRKAPIKIVVPSEGVGWEIGAVALIKGSPQQEAAKKIIDIASSDEIAKLSASFAGITARPEFIRADIQESADKMIDNNFEWAAKNRDKFLKEWKERFAK